MRDRRRVATIEGGGRDEELFQALPEHGVAF
jgi:hypothetical protein